MTILITGGAGFIGSNLARYYTNKGEKVIVIDNFFRGRLENLDNIGNNLLEVFELDLSDAKCKKELARIIDYYRPTKIFHYAAINGTEYFYDQPSLTQTTNSISTQYLVDALNLIRPRNNYKPLIIFASTSENYGNATNIPTSESDMTYVDIESVRDSYAVAKLNSEFTVKLNSESIGYNYIILRIFNVYGPNMVGSKYGQVIPEFIQRLTNTEYPLKIIGTGEETRSFCYIDDHVLLTDLLCNEIDAYNQVINLGNPHEISIRELAEHVMIAMNLQPKIISSERRPFDTVRRCPDISKLLSIVGDFDFTPLSIGLEKLLKIDHRTRHEN